MFNRALAMHVPVGEGHIVVCLRQFWRRQMQGTCFLAFDAILNRDHPDAGKPPARPASAVPAVQ